MTALDLICHFEGFRSEAYPDSAGFYTIGYGSRFWNGQPVSPSYPGVITEAEAMAQMAPEVSLLQNEITAACEPQTLTDNQLTALTSFAYNVGLGAFRGSTLHRLIVAGDMTSAAGQFVLWDKADGRVVQGILNRRIKERDIFLSQ